MIEKANIECSVDKRKVVINLLKNYTTLKKKYTLGLLSEKDKNVYELLTNSILLLNRREQEVIRLTYIENEDDVFDYVIQDQLRLSARTYYRIKENAINKIFNFLPNSLFDLR